MITNKIIPYAMAFLFLSLIACGDKKTNEALSWQTAGKDTMYICHTKDLGKTRKVNLSEWVCNFEVIQLENSDVALMQGWKIYITENYILQQSENKVKLYDRQGKYLCDVGCYGQGPEEHLLLYTCSIDESLNRICLAPFNHKKLLEYDLKGQFIRDIKIPMTHKGVVHYQPDGTLMLTHLQFKETKSYQYLLVDVLGTISFVKDERMAVTSRNKEGEFIGYNHEIWAGNNTDIFTYNIFGKDTLYAFLPEIRNTYNRLVLEKFGGRTLVATESSKAFFVHFYDVNMSDNNSWTPKANTIIIDKKKHEAYYAEVINDFVGGLPTNGLPFSREGWFCRCYEPMALLDMIDEHLSNNNCTAKERTALKKLVDTIDEDGNNVLFIGELKK